MLVGHRICTKNNLQFGSQQEKGLSMFERYVRLTARYVVLA